MYPSLLSLPGNLFADLDALQRQMDRLLGARAASSSIRAVERGSFPPINIGSTPEAIEIYAFAPGIAPDKLDVSVDKGLLTLSGERRVAAPEGAKTHYASERFDGGFRRTVALPDDADPDRVQATYRDGIVRIRIERREASRPRRIEVRDAT